MEKTYCERHPKVETVLRCSRCEKYICPKCAVLTPVGYRCKDCGNERSATHSLTPAQLILGCAVGGGLGLVASYIVPSFIGFFLIFAGAIIGGFVGNLVSRLIQRKSSFIVGAVTALGFLVGAVAEPMMSASTHGLAPAEALQYAVADPWPIVFAGVAALVAWSQLR